MTTYPNGQIPLDTLVHLYGEAWMTPATYERWLWLVAEGQRRHGWTAEVSPGANAYRDLETQKRTYANELAGNAAYPGTSSHGGTYDGRDAMAIDVGNWGQLGKDAWYQLARDAGFEPNVFDWEPWHIIDWTPYSAPTHPKMEEEMQFDNQNRIYWPNGYFNNYHPGVYNALKHWRDNGSELPGTEGTAVREVWVANDYMAERTAKTAADATVAALRAAGIPVAVSLSDADTDRIASEVVAKTTRPATRFEVNVVEPEPESK